jgi:hypothetical protein
MMVTIWLQAISGAGAQTQSQTASPERTIWDHNGSLMYLLANGSSREFYYQKPRPGMSDAGARPGSLLFRGQINDERYSGTAYIFNPRCGPIPFEVNGSILDDNQRIVLTGQAPRVGRDCRANGSYTSNLEFKRSKPEEAVQSQEPLTAVPAPLAGEPKAQEPSRTTSEPPSAPKGRPSEKSETSFAAKKPTAPLADPKVPSTPKPEAATNETSGAKSLNTYLWGAAFVVMIVWLLIFSFGKMLLGL